MGLNNGEAKHMPPFPAAETEKHLEMNQLELVKKVTEKSLLQTRSSLTARIKYMAKYMEKNKQTFVHFTLRFTCVTLCKELKQIKQEE